MPERLEGLSVAVLLAKAGRPKAIGYSRYTHWQVIVMHELTMRELYDHANDPDETVNPVLPK